MIAFLCVLVAVACGVRLGWLLGHERGHRRGMRSACELLANKPQAGESAAEWLHDLEREGTRYL